jgi:hypothetical protein
MAISRQRSGISRESVDQYVSGRRDKQLGNLGTRPPSPSGCNVFLFQPNMIHLVHRYLYCMGSRSIARAGFTMIRFVDQEENIDVLILESTQASEVK